MTTSKKNILKSRDDKTPLFFEEITEEKPTSQKFKLANSDSTCSWITSNQEFGSEVLRPRIEPWLTALFQSEHLSLLLGSGLTHAVHQIATDTSLPGMNAVTFTHYSNEIEKAAKISAEKSGRDTGNIEDQIRTASELIRGLEITGDEKYKYIQKDLKTILESFSKSILKGESDLISSDSSKRETAFNYLVSFLMSFASRTGTRDRLQIFTTNYDRYIETGADLAGLHLLDRFVGVLSPIFRSSRLDIDIHYNPPGIRGEPRYLEGVAKFTKLHGSVDWINTRQNIRRIGVPFGAEKIDPYLKTPGLIEDDVLQLMVYPNAAKDRETSAYPYVELFRDFASATCRPNSTLISYGYSFGDEHINRVIEDMLTIPSTHLVIISYDDPLERIMRTYERLGRHAQITLLIGPHLGDFQTLVDCYLPKPAIDKTTFRMAELLKSRWGTESMEQDKSTPNSDSQEVSFL